ncbi:TPA: stage V sporulation protein E [Patescibacteria group bacterium]|nr:MAG: Cell division-specific peptidoglycan biosynthesis regulator FtsW [Parcubacteria group bacterium GW2011_GWF2_40_10]KKR47647.1 MAG: Cell division-specific peptidoglycan biosynthesis regulator FtsW [Parcubacteria group bacterium GW2011_GWA2_40_143]KKR60012.1 MAG: Cell division-specific peptidoglycan biosynthesis regulator FtsW [Parcubacteria group bacterium GW2011_GWC2_40_31]KKR77650.1 MAG: Cell division-specific peptidoglycan biosynthesis regulator FtsW [Parcubacteria group bacterium GW201
MSKKRGVDKVLFWIVCFAVMSGLFILLSSSMGLLAKGDGSSFHGIIAQQSIFAAIGMALFFFFISKVHYKKLAAYALPIFIFGLVLTVLVFIPGIGFSHGGARRWVKMGPLFFQPTEVLKFSFVVYLAAWMASKHTGIKNFYTGFLPFIGITAMAGLLIMLEPDMGTMGLLVVTGVSMFFVGGGKLKHLLLMLLAMLMVFSLMIYMKPYRMERVKVFLNPSYDEQGAGYQLKQSLIAIGSGGLFGKGFGMSVQKFKYLPEPIGDSIFAVYAEEFGFFGSLFIISLFLFFLYKGFSVSIRAPDDFGRLLGVGLVILIVAQAFINIAAMIGIAPLTGMPLTFVSKGGSALIVALVEAGILLNISKYSKK